MQMSKITALRSKRLLMRDQTQSHTHTHTHANTEIVKTATNRQV